MDKKQLMKLKQDVINKTKIVTMKDRLDFIKRLVTINKALERMELEEFQEGE